MLLSVGMPGTGRLFMSCRAAFRGAYERCGFNTPGQLTHILRHTFASHYMMGGGDILGLQRILGHATIAMTMRYAHMSPDHLESALHLSPLAQSGHREILRRSSGYSVRLVGIKSA
jgi:integrase